MTGPYMRRSSRVLRVLLLLACVFFGTIAAILGIAIIAMMRAPLWGALILGVGVGAIVLAFLKHDRWHMIEHRLE